MDLPRGPLTPRQHKVLLAYLEEGGVREAADVLGRSFYTVRQTLTASRSKVGAISTAQMVWMLYDVWDDNRSKEVQT